MSKTLYILSNVLLFIHKLNMASFNLQKKHAHLDSKNPPTEWNENEEPKLQQSTRSRGKTPRLELTTDVSPIAPCLGINIHCPHKHSYMKSSHPIMFIRFPYRPSLMTYLREVQGKPIDTMGSSYTSGEPTKVYAAFQNHWNPAVDIPVLSIVGTCTTTLSPPILTRKTYEYATITIMASTDQTQQVYEFKVPLIQQILTCSNKIVLQTVSAIDLADQLSTFIIHPQNPKEPLALIKIWNLSAYGCQTLHLQGLYEVPRIKVTEELHLLGLSGDRDTTYQIQLPPINSPILSLLEELDLQALGYRQKIPNKPIFPIYEEKAPTDKTDHNLITRMVPQRATFRHVMSKNHVVVPTRTTRFKQSGASQAKPCFYPPPIIHQPGFPFGMIKPLLFPAGFHTYKNLIADKLLTVKDIVNDMSADSKCARTGLEMFAERFDISPTLAEEYLNHSFEYFYKSQIARMPEKKVQYFVRPANQDIIPTEWIHATKHPAVSNIHNKIKTLGEGEDVTKSQSLTGNDWSTQLDDIDIELINDDDIDTAFWFPDEKDNEGDKQTTKAMVHASKSPEPAAGTQKPVKNTNSDDSFIETIVNQSMAKFINAPPFVPATQRLTRSKAMISELVKSPPPGYVVNPVTLSPNPRDPALNDGLINTPQFHSPVEFLDGRLSPLSPCFRSSYPSLPDDAVDTAQHRETPCTPTVPKQKKTTITFGSFPTLEVEDKKIQAVINSSDTQLVDSIKQILARHGITGTFP
jgi:hypothetical protein